MLGGVDMVVIVVGFGTVVCSAVGEVLVSVVFDMIVVFVEENAVGEVIVYVFGEMFVLGDAYVGVVLNVIVAVVGNEAVLDIAFVTAVGDVDMNWNVLVDVSVTGSVVGVLILFVEAAV